MVDPSLLDEQKTESALDSLREAAMALPEEKLRSFVNVNGVLATTVALGAIPRLMELRDRAAKLCEFDVSCFDQLETLTLAFFQAHAAAQAAAAPPADLPKLAEEGIKRRREFLDDMKPLSNRGLLDETRLAGLGGGTSYREIALDLQIVVTVLRLAWSKIKQSTPITPDDIRSAEALARSLLFGVSRRDDKNRPEAAQARDLELRIFTLFANAYRQVERAVDFLCWDEEPNSVAPTIYGGRGKGDSRSKKPETEVPKDELDEPEAPVAPTVDPVPPVGDPNSPPCES